VEFLKDLGVGLLFLSPIAGLLIWLFLIIWWPVVTSIMTVLIMTYIIGHGVRNSKDDGGW